MYLTWCLGRRDLAMVPENIRPFSYRVLIRWSAPACSGMYQFILPEHWVGFKVSATDPMAAQPRQHLPGAGGVAVTDTPGPSHYS